MNKNCIKIIRNNSISNKLYYDFLTVWSTDSDPLVYFRSKFSWEILGIVLRKKSHQVYVVFVSLAQLSLLIIFAVYHSIQEINIRSYFSIELKGRFTCMSALHQFHHNSMETLMLCLCICLSVLPLFIFVIKDGMRNYSYLSKSVGSKMLGLVHKSELN